MEAEPPGERARQVEVVPGHGDAAVDHAASSTCLPPYSTTILTPHGRRGCATPTVPGPIVTPQALVFVPVDGAYGAASAVYHGPPAVRGRPS